MPSGSQEACLEQAEADELLAAIESEEEELQRLRVQARISKAF